MAEMGKGVTAGKLAINVQKKFTRAQEKVLQRLGKADETRDAAFEETVNNFNKQMVEGSKLQKDLKVYLTAVKTMHEASRRLQDCLADMYEPEWFGKEEIDSMAEEMIEKDMDNNLEEMDMTWIDYHEKITDDSLLSLDTYLSSFPDIKARIAKRERKMVDFDSARHHFASLQKGKKKDEAKIAKPTALLEMAAPSWAQGLISAHQVAQTNLSMNQAEEELGRAQKVFEELNVELQDELPALWDSRVGVYVNTFQNLAGNQEKFHKEMGKLSQNLNDVMAKLDEQRLAKKGGPTPGCSGDACKSDGANHSVPPDSPATRPGPLPSCPQPRASPAPGQWQDEADACSDEAPVSPGADMASLTTAPEQEQPSAAPDTQGCDDLYPQESHGDWEEHDGGDGGGVAAPQEWDCTESSEGLNHDGTSSVHASYVQPSWDDNKDDTQDGQGDWGEAGGIQNAVANGSGGELPPGFLYKVKALHDYAATDGDELELKTGDMVLVLAFDNPDEQDDGWLLGVHQSHWLQNRDISVKGVFPENFTQKL